MKNGVVLLVDDSPLVLRMLGAFLEKNGLSVITARDGLDAVEKIYSQFPDIILLDIMMPRMNGYQVCRLLKNDEETRDIPVVMFTSKDKGIERFLGLQTGADSYVTKNISYDNLLQIISEQLEARDRPHADTTKCKAPITFTDILTKTNGLLDRKLYEVTIVNRIVTLARDIRAYRDIVDKVLEIVREIIGSPVAAFAILDDESVNLFVKSADQPDEDDLREIEDFFFSQVKGSERKEISHSIETTVLAPKDSGARKIISRQELLYAFRAKSNVRPNEWRGFILYGQHPRHLSAEEGAVMELILEQALVVIENAYLFERIRLKAVTDELTGLFNRRYFFKCLDEEYRRMLEGDGVEHALALLDIDKFKSINDTYGHMVGDEVLRELSKILKSVARCTDIVARFGGEEFIVLLPDTTLSGGVGFTERLRNAVEIHEFQSSGQRIPVTVSVGLSMLPKDDQHTVEEAISEADTALYKAKSSGRNRVCVYEGH
jgi:two-component system cell cycle response regulator